MSTCGSADRPLQHLPEEHDAARLVVAVREQVDRADEPLTQRIAGIDELRAVEAPDEQCGADEEQERQRHLGDDEHLPKPSARGPAVTLPAASFNVAADIRTRRAKRRDEAEHERGDERDRNRERQHASADRRAEVHREWRRRYERSEQPGRPVAHARCRRGRRRAARSRLSIRNCRTRRPRLAPIASRTATSRLRPAARASSRPARFAQAISSTTPTTAISVAMTGISSPLAPSLPQRDRRRAAARVGVGILLLEPPAEDRDRSLRLAKRHPLGEPAEHRQPGIAALSEPVAGHHRFLHGDRHEHVEGQSRERPVEAGAARRRRP